MLPQISLNITTHNIPAEIERDIDKKISEFAEMIPQEVARIMTSGTRSGNLYQRGHFSRRHSKGFGQRAEGPGTRIHRASAPGEPLSSDTGRTVSSMSVRRLASGVYRIRLAGGIGWWELKVPEKYRRPTLMTAIENSIDKVFG